MQAWLANPHLMEAEAAATYHTTFDIDLSTITEPILCCPNDPDDAKKLSDIGEEKMDEAQFTAEGFYSIYGKVGARTEMPGCSLCMGNQARVAEKSTVVSTSTRNFPNRLGQGANVYLASAELAAIAAILGKLPTKSEYLELYSSLLPKKADTYKYLNFDQYENFVKSAEGVTIDGEVLESAKKTHAAFVA